MVSTLVRRGPTRQLSYLCQYLPEYGYDPHIVTLSPEPVDTISQDFDALDISRESLGLSRLEGLLLATGKLRTRLKRLDPDIIATQGIRADGLLTRLDLSTPWVMTARNFPFEDYPAKFGWLRGRLMAQQHLNHIKKASNPVACSNTLQSRLKPYAPGITAIQNGVDTDAFVSAKAVEKVSLRQDLDLPPEAKIFVSVGALIPRKAPETTLKAFMAAQLENDTMLLILGGGPLMAQLKSSVGSNERIRFAGDQTRIRDYLCASDVFVTSSRSEGFPNSVLEAVSCGLPLVVSNIGPHLEIADGIEDFVQTAAVDDVASFQAALEAAEKMDVDVVQNSIRNHALERLSGRSMTKRYASLFDTLVPQ